MNKNIPVAVSMLIINSHSLIALDNFYDNSREGWFFYKDEPKEQKKDNIIKKFTEPKKQKSRYELETEFMRNIPINNLTSLTTEEFRQIFQKAKDIAVMRPTEENVLILQTMNTFMTDQAKLFTEMWQSNIINHTKQVVGENIAMSAYENKFKLSEEKQQDKEAFDDLIQDGFKYVIFFKENDRKLGELKRLIVDFVDKRIPIHFVDINKNKELIERHEMTDFPEIFAITDKEPAKHIHAGMTTAERIKYATKIQYKNYFMKHKK